MKLVLSNYELNDPIEFEEGHVNVLVIENPDYMSKIIKELLSQSDGVDGGFELFENNASIKISENLSIIVDPFSININERDILNKLYSIMKKDALDEELYLTTNTFLSEIENNIKKIMERQPNLLESDIPDIVGLFKLLNVHFIVSDSLIERICDYVDISSKYRKIKLFVFVNLKSFLSVSEMIQLYAHLNYHKIHILLIENRQSPSIECEIARIVDTNLCEIPIFTQNDMYKDNDIY